MQKYIAISVNLLLLHQNTQGAIWSEKGIIQLSLRNSRVLCLHGAQVYGYVMANGGL